MATACSCGSYFIEPAGPENAEIIIVGDWPNWFDAKSHAPFADEGVQYLLIREFARLGIPFRGLRRHNLWRHPWSKTTVCDIKPHLDFLGKELVKHKYALLMGESVVEAMCGMGASEVYGTKIETPLSSRVTVFAAPSPYVAVASTIGEFRLSVENFIKEIEDDKSKPARRKRPAVRS